MKALEKYKSNFKQTNNNSSTENQLFKKPKLDSNRCSDINLIKSDNKRVNTNINNDQDNDDIVPQIEAKRKQINCLEI